MLIDGRRWKVVAAVMEGGASQANPTLMAALTLYKPANKPPDPVITASAVLLRPSGERRSDTTADPEKRSDEFI